MVLQREKNMESKKKVALALGGGSVLGALHIGVLQAFEEHGIIIKAISGTSAGAIVATLYAFGKSPKEIEDIVLELEWSGLLNVTFSKYGFLSNKKIGNFIKRHIGEKNIEEAKIALSIVTTDITTGEKVTLKHGDVAKAVMASTCVPGIFVPVEIEKRLLVDGGIVENVPLNSLQNKEVDYKIGVDLLCDNSIKKPSNMIEVLYNSFYFLVKANKKAQTKEADIIIQPNLLGFNTIDMSQMKDLIKLGYEEAQKALLKIG